jgi:putative glutamine amidotransferase
MTYAAAMAPRIGVPLGLDAEGRMRPGRRTAWLDASVADAVADAGGLPLGIAAPADPPALVAALDGLLVPGGDDFVPDAPYPPAARFRPVAPEQLAFDRAVLGAALARGLPVLGICYGMQLLALHAGGRLLYDIACEAPHAQAHVLPEPEGRHGLRVAPGSRLAAALGERPGPVNSRHHQAVAAPGAGLAACAWSDDGLIEALEAEAPDRFVLGVQWHPERMDAAHRTRLFAAFVAACRAPR